MRSSFPRIHTLRQTLSLPLVTKKWNNLFRNINFGHEKIRRKPFRGFFCAKLCRTETFLASAWHGYLSAGIYQFSSPHKLLKRAKPASFGRIHAYGQRKEKWNRSPHFCKEHKKPVASRDGIILFYIHVSFANTHTHADIRMKISSLFVLSTWVSFWEREAALIHP